MDYQPVEIVASDVVNYPDLLFSKNLLGWPSCWVFDGSRELIKGNDRFFKAETPGPHRKLEYYVRKKEGKGEYILLLEKSENIPKSSFGYTLINGDYWKNVHQFIQNKNPEKESCKKDSNLIREKLMCEQNHIINKLKPLGEKIISYYRDFNYQEMLVESVPIYKEFPVDRPYSNYDSYVEREKKREEFYVNYPGEFLIELPRLGSHWFLTKKYRYKFEQDTMDLYLSSVKSLSDSLFKELTPSIENINWKQLTLYRWKPIPEAECRAAFAPLDRDPAIPDELKPHVSGP